MQSDACVAPSYSTDVIIHDTNQRESKPRWAWLAATPGLHALESYGIQTQLVEFSGFLYTERVHERRAHTHATLKKRVFENRTL